MQGPSLRLWEAAPIEPLPHRALGDIPAGRREQAIAKPTAEWLRGTSPRVQEAVCLHPRRVGRIGNIPARGEQTCAYQVVAELAGPPPRVRGTAGEGVQTAGDAGTIPARAGAVFAGLLVYPDDGNIPADAGSRGRQSSARRMGGDHPRACREQQPPLRQVSEGLGTILTGAGSRSSAGGRPFLAGAIPRARGTVSQAAAPLCELETTLRMRGTLARHNRHLWLERTSSRVRGAAVLRAAPRARVVTILTRAGSSPAPVRASPAPRDHPRGCREQGKSGASAFRKAGTSPRVQESGRGRHVVDAGLGNIPADAGSRGVHQSCLELGRDHPCACGEHSRLRSIHTSSPGPTPLEWGAVRRPRVRRRERGHILAGAGNRPSTPGPASQTGEHPSACGEQATGTFQSMGRSGPSRRVRGAVAGFAARSGAGGTIPAGAGSSSSSSGPKNPRRDHPRACGE
jgi:hypothetical protein